METKHLSCAETAKIVRDALKEAFKEQYPQVKFSVRSRTYSMGASISVKWTNGPTMKQVDAVVRQYEGSTFDGMIDLKSYHDSMYKGEKVHFGADSVHTSRSLTKDFLESIAQEYCNKWHCPMPKIDANKDGSHAWCSENHYNRIAEEVQQLAYATPEKPAKVAKESKKAAKQTKIPEQTKEVKETATEAKPVEAAQTTQPTINKQVSDVLKECTISGKVLYLPNHRLDRALYVAVNEVLTRLGGKWNKKAKGHVFECDPTEELQAILNHGNMPAKNPTAYYATPSNVAQDIIFSESLPANAKRILEPSAGTGSLAREIDAYCQARGIRASIDCCEILPKHQQKLQEQGFFVVATNFLNYSPISKYDAIVMNPPFSVEGDTLAYITHIEHAWSLLANGGALTAIAPAGFAFRTDKRTAQFRSLVEQYGSWYELDNGAFQESGTGVKTVVISMKKPA